jgi:hypothetical protein
MAFQRFGGKYYMHVNPAIGGRNEFHPIKAQEKLKNPKA